MNHMLKGKRNRRIIQHFVPGIKGGEKKKNRRRNRRKRTGIDQAAVWLMIVDYCSQCEIKRKKKNQPKKDGNRMKQSSESWSESQRSKNVKNTAARVWISSDSDYRAEKKGHLMISGQSKTLCCSVKNRMYLETGVLTSALPCSHDAHMC